MAAPKTLLYRNPAGVPLEYLETETGGDPPVRALLYQNPARVPIEVLVAATATLAPTILTLTATLHTPAVRLQEYLLPTLLGLGGTLLTPGVTVTATAVGAEGGPGARRPRFRGLEDSPRRMRLLAEDEAAVVLGVV